MLATSRRTVARLVASGELKVVGIGRGRRVVVA
jgi:excisionase family DNA binding protein